MARQGDEIRRLDEVVRPNQWPRREGVCVRHHQDTSTKDSVMSQVETESLLDGWEEWIGD